MWAALQAAIGQAVSVDATEARRLLHADDTAVIDEVATNLVYACDVSAMALVCEALATTDGFEIRQEILWVLSPAWKSGDVEVPSLLAAVESTGSEDARRGANEALRWLGLRST